MYLILVIFVCDFVLSAFWSFATSSQLMVLWERSSWLWAVKEKIKKANVESLMQWATAWDYHQPVLSEQDKSYCMASELVI